MPRNCTSTDSVRQLSTYNEQCDDFQWFYVYLESQLTFIPSGQDKE